MEIYWNQVNVVMVIVGGGIRVGTVTGGIGGEIFRVACFDSISYGYYAMHESCTNTYNNCK